MSRRRKLNRGKDFNYDQNGWYFITICTKDKINYFGEIKSDKILLSEIGKITLWCWKEIPKHFENIELDEFMIMPDHIHGIIKINNTFLKSVGNADLRSLQNKENNRTKMQLSLIIHGFKSSVTRMVHKNFIFEWQKSYYDRIIRNEKEYLAIKQYIKDNPKNWNKDSV